MLTPSEINAAVENVWPEAPCSCLEVGPEQAVAVVRLGEGSIRPDGYINGPTLFAAADVALWYLAFGASGRIDPAALTADLSIRFLRPARGQVVYARAVLNKANRRSVIGTMTVWTDQNEDEPCATAQGTYVLPGRGE